MFLRIALLVLGVFAGSTAVIMIKASRTHWAELSSYRLLVAAAALAPLYFRDLRRRRSAYTAAHVRGAVLPGLLLGLHFFTWVVGARMTMPANANLIVNMVPVAMPFLLLAMTRERLTGGELGGTGLALAGTAVLTGGDASLSAEYLWGDLLCLGSMVLFASYLALGRKNRHYPSVWLYLVPVYLVGGVFCLGVSACLQSPLHEYPPRELLLIAGLGVVPTVIGHSILNYTMRHMRGQIVAIANLGQFLFAGLMGWLLPQAWSSSFGTAPTWNVYVAGVLVVAGVALAIWKTPPARSRREEEIEKEVGQAGSV